MTILDVAITLRSGTAPYAAAVQHRIRPYLGSEMCGCTQCTSMCTHTHIRYTGGFARKGDWKYRISRLHQNFRAWFLAQIVENLVVRGLFLGPGDLFWKSYDENKIRRRPYNFWNRRWRVMDHVLTSRSQVTSSIVRQICNNLVKNYPQDFKIV